jgi:hypothetical protein
MSRRVRIFSILAVLGACNLPDADALDPTAVVTGIYTLTATSQSDTCDPQRFIGAVTVPIFAGGSAIVITDQSSSVTAPTLARYDLPEGSGYTAEIPPAGATFAPCPSGGTFSLDFALTAATASAFDVEDDETWTIVSACDGTTIDAATVPAASCSASRTLAYTLVQSCATPCTIVETDLVPSCTCPQGSASE